MAPIEMKTSAAGWRERPCFSMIRDLANDRCGRGLGPRREPAQEREIGGQSRAGWWPQPRPHNADAVDMQTGS